MSEVNKGNYIEHLANWMARRRFWKAYDGMFARVSGIPGWVARRTLWKMYDNFMDEHLFGTDRRKIRICDKCGAKRKIRYSEDRHEAMTTNYYCNKCIGGVYG